MLGKFFNFKNNVQKPDEPSEPKQIANSNPPLVTVKYPKPNIVLMDIDPKVAEVLRKQGFNISEGSFGTPYKVGEQTSPRNDRVYTVLSNSSIPEHLLEQEIIIVDLAQKEVAEKPFGTELILKQSGEPLYARAPFGIVNPRPVDMWRCRSDFDKIYHHGGIFIVFAGHKWGYGDLHNDGFLSQIRDSISTWSFLSDLDAWLIVTPESGKEIRVEILNETVFHSLQSHILDSFYECTLDAYGELKNKWIPFATNKFGKAIAGMSAHESGGLLLVFPQVKDKSTFLTKLLTEVLPSLAPRLFPDFEGMKWVERTEYEIPKILALKSEIQHIREQATGKITELEEQIQFERTSSQYLHDLITETADKLVNAVSHTLRIIGFTNVVDMDTELAESGSAEPKREDLQIRDQSPLILVEVKGITGFPKDSSSLQVSKYLAPRMKALKRTDIRGLSIINHHRNIPPFERKENPFNPDVLESSEAGDYGLLTTWNLYKLTRNYQKLGWSHEQISNLFYQNGFLEPIPSHYQLAGVVENFWEKVGVVGVRITETQLSQNDQIAFELPVEFEEQKITSLQVEREPVEHANIGVLAGILTNLSKNQLRKGTRVFRVQTQS